MKRGLKASNSHRPQAAPESEPPIPNEEGTESPLVTAAICCLVNGFSQRWADLCPKLCPSGCRDHWKLSGPGSQRPPARFFQPSLRPQTLWSEAVIQRFPLQITHACNCFSRLTISRVRGREPCASP